MRGEVVNYSLFIVSCMMVYWPTLVLWGAWWNFTDEPRQPLATIKGVLKMGCIAIILTIISLGFVLAWRSFV